MRWFNSPDFFCSVSKTVANNTNAYALDPTSPFSIYPPTAKAYHTSATLLASSGQLQHIDVYMDDLLCATQGDTAQQKRVSELTLCALKEIFYSVPGETKESASLDKIMSRDDD